MIRHGPGEPFCCPTLADVREYVREGNRLRLVSSAQPDAPVATPAPPRTGSAGLAAGTAGGATATNGVLVLATVVLVIGTRRALRAPSRPPADS